MILKGLAERFGLVPRRKGRGVIIWAPSTADFASVAGVIESLGAQNPRVNFYLVSDDPEFLRADELPAGIRQAFRRPIPLYPFCSFFLVRTRPQAILLAGGEGDAAFLAAAKRRAVPIHSSRSERDELEVALQASILDESRKYSGGAGRFLRMPGIRGLSERRFREISSLEALADELGRPRRILCLGNGPSSESEEVRGLEASEFNTVFRVNHRWMDRGLFTQPHVVFTAGSKPVRLVGASSLFCAQDRQRAERIRLACLHLKGVRRLIVAEELKVLGDWEALELDGFGAFAPTNGAVMLAVARALKPSHVTVAGVDLFSDPRGAYPGDARTPNAYGIFHSFEKEREYTLRWIQGLREDGTELRIIGEALTNAAESRV